MSKIKSVKFVLGDIGIANAKFVETIRMLTAFDRS